ncbi:MAG: hypothetical protein LCH56_01870 [Proteobacteria bacterium]|nr:hypothetical protein [Pseudomonadota bacterium]
MENNPEYDEELRAALIIGFHARRGIELAANKMLEPALLEFDAALKVCPTFAEAWLYRGLTLRLLKRFDQACDSLENAVVLTPMFAEAQDSLAPLAAALGRISSIYVPWLTARRPNLLRRSYRKLMKHFAPKVVSETQPLETEKALREAFSRAYDSAELATKLALCMQRQRREKEAESFFRYALFLEPWNGNAAAGLCNILNSASRAGEALSVAAEAMKAGCLDARLPAMAYAAAVREVDWTNVKIWREQAAAAFRSDARSVTGHAYFVVDDPELHRRAAETLSQLFEAASPQMPTTFRRSPQRRITIGYISPDFRDHPVARLIAEVFELHDRTRFKVIGYGLMPDAGSEIGDRIRKSFDKFFDVSALSPRACVEAIRADGVDILIDLAGNTANGPNSIIARRAAPVQVNYLGDPGTSANPNADYIIVDETIAPAEHKPWYSEAMVHLPDCYQANDRKRAVSQNMRARTDYGFPADSVVFCAFNEPRKLSPEIFDVWMRILSRVPGSFLWLYAPTDKVAENFKAEAAKRGCDPQRLKFAARLPNPEHLARYHAADLLLDTPTYNGHTTASDALWCGCPVLTILGNAFPARVGASILKAVGLPELVTTTMREYEDLAVRIGLNSEIRRELRRRTENARSMCALFDTPRFVRQLEWAFEHMWTAYLNGEAPAPFAVPSLRPI